MINIQLSYLKKHNCEPREIKSGKLSNRKIKTFYEQDRQCTYNVTLRRVRETMVAMEKQYVLHVLCVCSLRYPA
jgi:hypothetical protein